MTEPKISVNLVTYNGEKYLPFCLQSLKKQTFQNFELKVIDNGSNDRSADSVLTQFPETKIIRYQKNLGFAAAHNQLIAWSKTPYILILNQDVILSEDYLAKVFAWLESHPEAAGVMGKIIQWDFVNNKTKHIIDSLGLELKKNHQVIDLGQGESITNFQDQAEKEVFGLSGALPLFRKSALETIKMTAGRSSESGQKWEYFDEDFFSYKEDVDLAYRLRLAGLKTFYLPVAVAYHGRAIGNANNNLNRRETRKNRASAIKIFSYKNHLAALYKNEFTANLCKFFWPICWYEFKKFAYLVFFERTTLQGLSLLSQDLGKIRKKRKYIIKNIRKITAADLAAWYK